MRSIITVLAFLALARPAAADPIQGKHLVGAWELTKVEGQADPPRWRIEFKKDGKMSMASKRGDKEYKVEGAYKLDKDKLTLTTAAKGEVKDTRTVMVQKLTDKVLLFVDNKKKLEFERAK